MPTDSVTVAVRLRPFNTRELNQKEGRIVKIGNEGYVELTPSDESLPGKKFNFDFSYDWDTDQETVYQDLGKPLLYQVGSIYIYINK